MPSHSSTPIVDRHKWGEEGFLCPSRNVNTHWGLLVRPRPCSAACLRAETGPDLCSREARVWPASLQDGSGRVQAFSPLHTLLLTPPTQKDLHKARAEGEGLSPSAPSATLGNEDMGGDEEK